MHADSTDQETLEQSLITHNHLELLLRIRHHCQINLAAPHNELLALLATFYKTHRYDRFSISSIYDLKKEKDALCSYIGKHLNVNFSDSDPLFRSDLRGTPGAPDSKPMAPGVPCAEAVVVRRRSTWITPATVPTSSDREAREIRLAVERRIDLSEALSY